MRVLQVINDLRTGGAETLCSQLAERLRKRGIDSAVHVLEARHSPIEVDLRAAGIPVTESTADSAIRSPRHIHALRAFLLRERYDIVHVHLYPAQLWTALAVMRLPVAIRPRLITTEHNTFNGRRGIALFRAIDGWMYRCYDAIVAISDPTARYLNRWAPGSAQRTEVIRNGIDWHRFADAPTADRANLGLGDAPPEAPLLLCVGRLERQKNQATLLKALALLPPRAHVALAGEGRDDSSLRVLAAELGLTARVHFLGRREDVPALMKASTVYVQPSLWEGFGLAVAEAMAAGLPVVVTGVAGVSEVVGDSGLTARPNDPGALAEQIDRLLSDPELSRLMIRRGRERSRLFTLDRFVDAHLSLYEKTRQIGTAGQR